MTDGDLGYVELFGPGRGFAPARASQAMGSARLSLNGTWKFRYRESLRNQKKKKGVVSRVLPRGSGHVVAVRHLPRRDPDQRAGRLVRDFFVHADYDADHGAGLLTIDTDRPATLSVPELGITGAAPAPSTGSRPSPGRTNTPGCTTRC